MRDETLAAVDAAIDALPDDAPGGIEVSLLSLVESIRAVVQQRDAALAELEAARAVVEKGAGYIAHLEVVLLGRPGLTHDEACEGYVSAQAHYDAAKAGKAVE